ncbi:rCG31812 [Rattus norvegicus]|uniref:RCG31812 n=1 Tax=Rattus norvegicus TaxID=10116 RepID=A6JND2_RAT|nr:rCG31812 [Rattus norvegicus]
MPRTCVSRIMNHTALLPSPAGGGGVVGQEEATGDGEAVLQKFLTD